MHPFDMIYEACMVTPERRPQRALGPEEGRLEGLAPRVPDPNDVPRPHAGELPRGRGERPSAVDRVQQPESLPRLLETGGGRQARHELTHDAVCLGKELHVLGTVLAQRLHGERHTAQEPAQIRRIGPYELDRR